MKPEIRNPSLAELNHNDSTGQAEKWRQENPENAFLAIENPGKFLKDGTDIAAPHSRFGSFGLRISDFFRISAFGLRV
jgi:hypothetical protein